MIGDTAAFEAPLWRSLGVFRVAALAYAVVRVLMGVRRYAHPGAGWAVLAVMIGWTGAMLWAYARPRVRGWPLFTVDLVVATVLVLASRPIVGAEELGAGQSIIPVTWHAAPVLAWAVAGGRTLGVIAGAVLGVCDFGTQAIGVPGGGSPTGAVLLLLGGVTVGHVARLAVVAEERLQRATELEAANRERERLARDIHDSVLQVLALVQRRGAEIGGAAAELGRLAGEQEAALRALVAFGRPATDPDSGEPMDLRAALARFAAPDVTVAEPAEPVLLPGPTARCLAAAVGAALDNVRRHGGPHPRAWLLVEDEPEAVTVTVRDDGPGIEPGRLDAAAQEGRLGVAQSIKGRLAELGGTVGILSTPGEGTEVELRVPRTR
jgi:signal transduction histidine kinase